MARIVGNTIAVAALAVLTLGAGLTADVGGAEARDWRGGDRGNGGGRVAAGVAGGLLLGALAAGAAGGYYGGSGYYGGPGYYGGSRRYGAAGYYGAPGYYGGYDSDFEESPAYDTVPSPRVYYPQPLDYRAYSHEARGPRSSSSPHCRTELRPYFNGVRNEQRPAQICG